MVLPTDTPMTPPRERIDPSSVLLDKSDGLSYNNDTRKSRNAHCTYEARRHVQLTDNKQ